MIAGRILAAAVGLALAWHGGADAAEPPIRIATIEPLSGPPAAVGKWWTNHAQFAVDQLNAGGGVLGGRKVELVPFDSKSSPAEALIVLKAATDQGIRFVFGTAGSHVAIALSEAIAKHNARNPDARVLFLNYGGVAPELTNEQCNFWHFRFEANSDMKVGGSGAAGRWRARASARPTCSTRTTRMARGTQGRARTARATTAGYRNRR